MAVDTAGRAYASLSALKVGDFVQVDDGLTCIGKWQTRTVEHDGEREGEAGLYMRCNEGRHYLDGQLCDDPGDDALIGIYHIGHEAFHVNAQPDHPFTPAPRSQSKARSSASAKAWRSRKRLAIARAKMADPDPGPEAV